MKREIHLLDKGKLRQRGCHLDHSGPAVTTLILDDTN